MQRDYTGLSIPQIVVLDAMSNEDYERWVRNGSSKRALDVQIEEKNARAHKKGNAQVAPYFFAKPVESELVETIYTPGRVRALSADETSRLMKPIQWPELATSATEYAKSEEFRADTPALPSKQTAAQIEFECKAFVRAHPEYEKYFGDIERYGGLYELILTEIRNAGLLITDASLLDGFKWAAREGIIPSETTTRSGQVVKVHHTIDGRPGYWTKEAVRKAVSKMSAAELQECLNADREFRDMLDSM